MPKYFIRMIMRLAKIHCAMRIGSWKLIAMEPRLLSYVSSDVPAVVRHNGWFGWSDGVLLFTAQLNRKLSLKNRKTSPLTRKSPLFTQPR